MKQEELDKIVEQHQHWLKKDCECWEDMKANLSGADLSDADLRGANLRGVNLSDAKLYGAKLSEADLSDAKLYGANLNDANLRDANLRGANLRGADLSSVNLLDADLRGANLRGANLSGVNLYWAKLSEDDIFRLGKVLDEPLVGYKKTNEGVVITAEIPAGAIVFCINGSKCRTNKAKITDMAGHDVLHSQYDNNFEYRIGLEIEIKDFNLMYNVECASGFHFFKTRKEAEEYIG